MQSVRKSIPLIFLLKFLCLAANAQAELTPLLVPTLDAATNKFTGKSVIADSIDNQAQGQAFRDRIYYYDFILDAAGTAHVFIC